MNGHETRLEEKTRREDRTGLEDMVRSHKENPHEMTGETGRKPTERLEGKTEEYI